MSILKIHYIEYFNSTFIPHLLRPHKPSLLWTCLKRGEMVLFKWSILSFCLQKQYMLAFQWQIVSIVKNVIYYRFKISLPFCDY